MACDLASFIVRLIGAISGLALEWNWVMLEEYLGRTFISAIASDSGISLWACYSECN